MAEVTATWGGLALAGSMAPKTPGLPCAMAPGTPAIAASGADGGVAKLSERTDRVENILRELQGRLEASVATSSASDNVDQLAQHKATIASQAPGNMAVRGRGKLHWVALGGTEWPMPCWTTVCGWRFALH
eukprot:368600-Heterocapsa_arctica.AAC.1